MAALETEVTAVEVARELVATRLAFLQVFENLSGTDLDMTDGLEAWLYESPVPVGELEPVWERAREITAQIMRAVGAYFIEMA
jgi:hypothetical protein